VLRASRVGLRNARLRRLVTLAVAIAFVVASAPVPASARARCTAFSRDRDRDGLPDCWERRNGLTVGVRDQRSDKDRDSLTAMQEYRIDKRTYRDGSIFRPYQADERNTGWRGNVTDGYKDLDGDGFFNAAEFAWGTGAVRRLSFPNLPLTGCISVPRHVPADGSRSVTIELQAVIDTVPDGRCLSFLSGANYRSNGGLTIFNRHDFTVEGNGARLFTDIKGATPYLRNNPNHRSVRHQLQITSGSNIVVEDLVIDGPNPRPRFDLMYEHEAGIGVSGTDGVQLRDLRIKEVYGDFIQIGDWGDGSGSPRPATNILVTGGDFEIAGRTSIAMSESVEHVVIEGNSFHGMGRSGINLEILPGKHVTDVTVSNNTYSRFGLFWVGSQAQGPATDISFVGNRLVGETMQVKLGPSEQSGVRHSNWTFDSNTSDTEAHDGGGLFRLRNIDGFTVKGNTQPFFAGAEGVIFLIEDVCAVTLGTNDFLNSREEFRPTPPTC